MINSFKIWQIYADWETTITTMLGAKVLEDSGEAVEEVEEAEEAIVDLLLTSFRMPFSITPNR